MRTRLVTVAPSVNAKSTFSRPRTFTWRPPRCCMRSPTCVSITLPIVCDSAQPGWRDVRGNAPCAAVLGEPEGIVVFVCADTARAVGRGASPAPLRVPLCRWSASGGHRRPNRCGSPSARDRAYDKHAPSLSALAFEIDFQIAFAPARRWRRTLAGRQTLVTRPGANQRTVH